MALRQNSGKTASKKAATPRKPAASKGAAKKGEAPARSTRKSGANAASKSRPRTAPKGPVTKPASTARAPKRPAVPSRASSVKKATVPKSAARKTAGTGAGKAGSKPLAGGRSLSKKSPALKSATASRSTHEKTPLGRGGKGTPSPGTSGSKGARNPTVKRAQQASDSPARQKAKPSRVGSGSATPAAKPGSKSVAKPATKSAPKSVNKPATKSVAKLARTSDGARSHAASTSATTRSSGVSAYATVQPVSSKAPAQRSHQAPIPMGAVQPAAKLPKTQGKKGKRSGDGHITPEQALANTRALLAAKQQRAHQPPPYPVDDPIHRGHGTSDALAQIANERHLEEANKSAVQGHIAAQDRASQNKRDNRD